MSRYSVSRRRLLEFWNRNRSYYELTAESNKEAAPERECLFSFLNGGERVLDLGCGSCENAQWLPRSFSLIGVDVSMTGLVMAAEMDRPGRRIRANGSLLPIADQTSDAVISTWVIEHLHDPGRTLAEMIRVLKLDGLLLVVGSAWDLPYCFPPSLPRHRRSEVAWRRLTRQLRSVVDGRHRFDIVREPRALTEAFEPDSDAVCVIQTRFLRRYLQAAGMQIVKYRRLPHETRPSPVRRTLRRALGVVPMWRNGWGNLLLVARRQEDRLVPHYELQYL